jgi:polyisoprenyl-phosphate glycosyltransferase
VKTYSVVVPVYYNADSLLPLYERLQTVEAELATRNIALELVFVDDGSGDHSFEQLKKIKQQRSATTIIKLARNYGAVTASKTGLQHVTGDCATILAADLQDPPTLLLDMVDHWLNGEKFVICVREKRQDSPLSMAFSNLYYFLLRRLVSTRYPRGGFDMMLVDKSFLHVLQNSGKNTNLQLLAYWTGHNPVVIDYVRPQRPYGKSRWSFFKRLRFLLDSLLGFSIVPVRIISLIGLFVSFLSFAYGTLVVIGGLRGAIDAPGFATVTALVTFLLGLVIIMMGIIGEYVIRIFDEINKRPESVIDEIY